MSALFGEPAVLDYVDLVNFSDGGEAMGTVDYCFASHDLLQFTHDGLFSVCIQVTGCLVEQEYFGLWLEKATRDQNALALTARQFGA